MHTQTLYADVLLLSRLAYLCVCVRCLGRLTWSCSTYSDFVQSSSCVCCMNQVDMQLPSADSPPPSPLYCVLSPPLRVLDEPWILTTNLLLWLSPMLRSYWILRWCLLIQAGLKQQTWSSKACNHLQGFLAANGFSAAQHFVLFCYCECWMRSDRCALTCCELCASHMHLKW